MADILTKAGFPALRNENNGAGGEDVSHGIPGVWLEVCRAEKISLPGKYTQAQKASKGLVPIVLHRTNNKPWMAYLSLDYLTSLLQVVHSDLLRTPQEEE